MCEGACWEIGLPHEGGLFCVHKGAPTSEVRLRYPSERVDFPQGAPIYRFRVSAAWSMIYLQSGSYESFGRRWMGRTDCGPPLCCSQAGSLYSPDMINEVWLYPGGQIHISLIPDRPVGPLHDKLNNMKTHLWSICKSAFLQSKWRM